MQDLKHDPSLASCDIKSITQNRVWMIFFCISHSAHCPCVQAPGILTDRQYQLRATHAGKAHDKIPVCNRPTTSRSW